MFAPRRLLCLMAVLVALAAATRSPAAEEKMPHFASLRADLVNLRTGPGERYPIEWVYQRKGLPIEVLGAFDVWRKVRDSDGTEGWMHQRMLTTARSVVVKGALRPLRSDPADNATVVARAEPGVVARLVECRGAWCRIEAQDIEGWIRRSEIWGVLPDETVR
jgi:SH3-like domain-containing protein